MSWNRLETAREMMREALARAKKMDRLHKNLKRRLSKFPLWKRLFLSEFHDVYVHLKRFEMMRFACTASALNLSRLARNLERSCRTS